MNRILLMEDEFIGTCRTLTLPWAVDYSQRKFLDFRTSKRIKRLILQRISSSQLPLFRLKPTSKFCWLNNSRFIINLRCKLPLVWTVLTSTSSPLSTINDSWPARFKTSKPCSSKEFYRITTIKQRSNLWLTIKSLAQICWLCNTSSSLTKLDRLSEQDRSSPWRPTRTLRITLLGN
jgi:hypothetical protein